jgi:hypothetical protein
MIIWTRAGFLALLIPFLCALAMNVAVDGAFKDDHYYKDHGWPKLLACLLGGGVLWPLGRRLNQTDERQLLDMETGEVVRFQSGGGHTLFFIPVEYWSFIVAAFGVVTLFTSQQL